MRGTDAALARIAARQHGHVTTSDLREVGFGRRSVAEMTAASLLVPVHRGVFRHGAVPPSWVGRLHAAVLACGPGAAASHRSAARLHGFRDVPRWRPEVTVAGTRLPRHAGIDLHRTDTLDHTDLCTIDGIVTTTVARTLCMLGAVVHPALVATATQDALIRGCTTDIELVCVLERLGARGRRGVAALRTAIADGLPPAAIESRLEADLLALFVQVGLRPPALQHELVLATGRVRLDFAWPEHRLAVEADGRRWHSTTSDFERDLRRSRAIAAAGWRQARYGWSDVHESPVHVVTEVRALLALAAADAA